VALWANRDLGALKCPGGWKSDRMVLRYAHRAPPTALTKEFATRLTDSLPVREKLPARQKKFPAPTPAGICKLARIANGLQHNLVHAIAELSAKSKKIPRQIPCHREIADRGLIAPARVAGRMNFIETAPRFPASACAYSRRLHASRRRSA
jgi:hypothetical protein